MARASTYTQLPLDDFAKIIGYNPLHFNQVFVRDLASVTTCNQPLLQHSWQGADAVSREEIALAIKEAEDRISENLGFTLLPLWVVRDQRSVDRPSNPNLFNYDGIDIRGFHQSVKTTWGYVQYGGVQAKSLVAANADITYTDADGDGYFETATVVVPTTVTDVNEIAAYYPGKLGDDIWEIRPIRVVLAAGNAVIIFRREQCVLESLLESLGPLEVDGLNDANFLAEIDVYRKYNDPSTQVQFVWDNDNVCDCGLSTCATCSISTNTGCFVVRDERLGLIGPRPSIWNAVTQQYDSSYYTVGRAPDYVRLWYRAGWRNHNLTRSYVEMDNLWKVIVARYAVSLLDRPLCACDSIKALTLTWQEDLALALSSPTGSNTYRVSSKMFNNPLGTTRGALNAWATIQRYTIGEGI